MPKVEANLDAAGAALQLAQALEQQHHEYALGGAIALGYWAEPRGTIDVDLTLFLPFERPTECTRVLQQIGCELNSAATIESLREHGFCRVAYAHIRVDVFLPTIPFYEAARVRRRRVDLAEQAIMIWDAESLAVFKMMFFRRKDVADVEAIIRVQGKSLDRNWIRQQLVAMYGERDPRIAQWDELAAADAP